MVCWNQFCDVFSLGASRTRNPEVVGAALVLGAFCGGLLLEHWGGRSPFACAAVLAFVAVLALISFVPAP